MYTRSQIAIWAALAVVGLTFNDSNPIAAQTTKKAAKAAVKAAAKTVNTYNHTSILSELHQAKGLLDLGLHDYDGHRARADHEVHRVIHLLQHGHHHKGDYKTVFSNAVQQGQITNQTQQASDMKLRQAQKLIQSAHLQLMNMHKKHGHHHHREAAHLLTKASNHIDQALTIVQNYNQQQAAAVAGALVPVK